MSFSDKIQLIGIISTSLISVIAIIISVATLVQNSRMIEATARPYIVVYGAVTNFQSPNYRIIVKNMGQSGAIIKSFKTNYDLIKCTMSASYRPFGNIENTFFAPNQQMMSCIDYAKAISDTESITFDIKYSSGKKNYHETISLNLDTVKNNIITRAATTGKELTIISYTLQDLVEKQL